MSRSGSLLARRPRAWLPSALILSLAGCDPNLFSPSPLDAGAAPNASVIARPVVTTIAEAPDAGSDAGVPAQRDGGADAAAPPRPPQPYQADEAVAPEPFVAKELSGVVLDARFNWPGQPELAASPQADRKLLAALTEQLQAKWQIELSSSGRQRIDFISRGFPLARGTTLLARSDRYGHLLLWPSERRYRVLPPGTLRTVLSELRADVTPLATSHPEAQPDATRLGLSTRSFRLASAYGDVTLELATVAEAGAGAALLCRTLLELGGVTPAAELCSAEQLPLWAAYRWGAAPEGPAAVRFEVTALRKTFVQDPTRFAMLPQQASRERSGLPGELLPLNDNELRSLRTDDAPAPAPPQTGAPATGIEAYNGSDQLMWLFVDGFPVAGVTPYQTSSLKSLRNGRYTLHWRSFLADIVGDSGEGDVPARVSYGVPPPEADSTDAGPPP